MYIPVLPAALVEVLSTPTPFIAGIHSTVREQAADLLDVIIVDCDSGSIKIPECVNLPPMPEPMGRRLLDGLSLVSASASCLLSFGEIALAVICLCVDSVQVLSPELQYADCAFPKEMSKTSDQERLDKEIRAVFIRFFAELFSGYRACLQIVRIHSPPVIQFHKVQRTSVTSSCPAARLQTSAFPILGQVSRSQESSRMRVLQEAVGEHVFCSVCAIKRCSISCL